MRIGVYARAEANNVRFGTGRQRFACRMICQMSSRGSDGREEDEGEEREDDQKGASAVVVGVTGSGSRCLGTEACFQMDGGRP